MAKKNWSEMSPTQRRAVLVVGTVETVITGLALRDLSKRSSAEVRGPKLGWVLATFIQPVGPIAYFAWGRNPS